MTNETIPTRDLIEQRHPTWAPSAETREGQPLPLPGPGGRRPGTARRWAWVGVGTVSLLAALGTFALTSPRSLGFLFPTREKDPSHEPGSVSVQTTFPRQILVVRETEQAGTIMPAAQVELYAKTSGYLLFIRRDLTPAVVSALVGQRMLSFGLVGAPAIGAAGWQAGSLQCTLHQAPSVDIGSRIEAGDLLMEVDVPERRQDIEERAAALDQRTEELEQARTAIHTFEAGVTVAKAHLGEAKADVLRYESALAFKNKQLARVRSLVRQNAVERGLVDEKESEVAAARSAWDSSLAKEKAGDAEVKLAMSKLTTARGDVRVKEARVRAAVSELERARIMARYGRLYAPFGGKVTYRGVDEGDFVQNSQTGQARHLMTVTASDQVKVALQLPSREGLQVQVGAKAIVTVDSRPGETFHGRVARTRGQLDVQSRTLQVEIDLDNRAGRLVPGMYAHVKLALSETPNTWVVPAAALFSRNKVNYLIVVREGIANRQPVRIVFDSGGQLEVVKLVGGKEVPLNGTEELVVSGKGGIRDGQEVQAVRQGEDVARKQGSH